MLEKVRPTGDGLAREAAIAFELEDDREALAMIDDIARGFAQAHRPGPETRTTDGRDFASIAGRGVAEEVDANLTIAGPRLAGGQLLAAISTSIVGILREHYGRGPMKAKTYV